MRRKGRAIMLTVVLRELWRFYRANEANAQKK